jgi:hypothetical protein
VEFGVGGVLEQLIGPPGGFIFLSLLGLVLMNRYRRIGFYLTASGISLLYIASLPATAFILMSGLEPTSAINPNQIPSAPLKPQHQQRSHRRLL